jgi:hypothetical protein
VREFRTRLAEYVAAGNLVYMPCREPVLRLVRTSWGAASGISVGWFFEDMDSTMTPTKGGRWADPITRAKPGVTSWWQLDGSDGKGTVQFDIQRHADAVVMAMAYAERIWGYEFGEGCDDRSLVVIHDASRLEGTNDVVGYLESVWTACRNRTRGWGRTSSEVDMVLATRKVEEVMSRRKEDRDEGSIRAAMDAFLAAAKGMESQRDNLVHDTYRMALRWEAVERERDISQSLALAGYGSEDAEALASLAP